MKVSELIVELQKLNQDSELPFWIDDGCCGDYLDLDLYDVSIYDHDKTNVVGALRFSSLPGYRSCIQSSQTKRTDEERWCKK